MFKSPIPPGTTEHFDYETVEDPENEEDVDDFDDENPGYLKNPTPLSAVDVDIKIIRQKMSLAEAGLEHMRVRKNK